MAKKEEGKEGKNMQDAIYVIMVILLVLSAVAGTFGEVMLHGGLEKKDREDKK